MNETLKRVEPSKTNKLLKILKSNKTNKIMKKLELSTQTLKKLKL